MQPSFKQFNQEKKILELLNKGDRKTFALLFDYYSKFFFSIILKIVEDKHIAEDVLQNSFVTIYNNIRDFDVEKESLFIWMYKIVRKVSLNTLNCDLEAKKQKIKKLFDENSPSILHLIYFYGFELKEIAQELNISEDNLRKMVYKELKQFVKDKKTDG